MEQVIIGITGTLGAGKGTIVEYLQKTKGFKHYSMSDYITQQIKQRGLAVNRDNMVKVANDLRAKFGAAYIATELYKQAQQDGGDCVIESLRTPAEIEELQNKGNFYLLAIDADAKLRFERIKHRGSLKDGVDFNKFLEDEKREMQNTEPHKQNLSKCIAMADYKVDNSGSFEELYQRVEDVLNVILKD